MQHPATGGKAKVSTFPVQDVMRKFEEIDVVELKQVAHAKEIHRFLVRRTATILARIPTSKITPAAVFTTRAEGPQSQFIAWADARLELRHRHPLT
jgi:hypothetical protein